MAKLNAYKTVSGYTLIELLIVVVIIAILASMAYPMYTRYVIRTNQADAQDKLSEVMYEMERFAHRNRTYTTDLNQLGYNANADDDVVSDDDLYVVSASACDGGIAIARCVRLTATPVAGLSQEGNGNFTLTNRGEKGFTGTDGGWKK